jgi:very-short-patch-repair endonuclease
MKDKVKSILVGPNNNIIPQRSNKEFLKKHNLYNYINDSYDDSYSLSEKIYCIVNNLDKRKQCKHCGKELIFNHGYSTFCSRKCSNNYPEVLEKNKKNVSKSLKIAYSERGDQIKEKRKKTLYEKYNEESSSPFGISCIQDKIKNTIKERYGVDNVFYLDKFRSNGKEISQKRSIEFNKLNGYDIEYLNKGEILVKSLCKIHGDVKIDTSTFYNRTYKERTGIVCPICNPKNSFSSLETEFEKILIDLNINYIKNSKKLIYPYELDFYVPDKNLAFELNGIYWHSELHKDKNYHYKKSNLCEEQGIQLIHIWEDDFYDNYELIKSICESKLGLNHNKIYARKCSIEEISSYEYRKFLNENHIQKSINSSIRYGLFYNKELVSVLGLGKLRIPLGSKNKTNTYELHRFCSKKYYTVVGGASKLLSHFEKNYKWEEIITYAKRDYSNGNLYYNLDFHFIKNTGPGYYWLVDNKRKHRYNYRKDKIANKHNKHLTAVEIMHNKGYVRCYDSGNLKFNKTNVQKHN